MKISLRIINNLAWVLGTSIVAAMLVIIESSWQQPRPHIAVRVVGPLTQIIDRDDPLGQELRVLQFACPDQPGRWHSYNQLNDDGPILFIMRCDGSSEVTTVPWWFDLTFTNAPTLTFPGQRTDESVALRDRA